MELYHNNGVHPPDHLKQAMKEAGIPEADMWNVRADLLKLEQTPPVQLQKKQKRQVKKVPIQSGPPEVIWDGTVNFRGHSVNLNKLSVRDWKSAAAHDDMD